MSIESPDSTAALTPEHERLLDSERAGPMRVRAVVVALVSLAIWLSQYLLYEAEIFERPAQALPYRLGELALTSALALYLVRPRPARRIEWATVVVFSALAVLHGWAILICRDEVVVPFTLTLEWSAMVIVLAAGLSWRPAVVFLAVTFTAGLVATGIRARWDTDFSDHIVLLGIYGLLAASVRGYDRLRRKELIARTALAAANDELRRTERARARLFTNISHDFRTPLALIHGEAELLLGHASSDDDRSALGRIQDNARALAEVTEQLLELAQLGEGRLVPRAKAFDVIAICHEVARATGGPTSRVRMIQDEALPLGVEADPRHVRRILTNLVGNAVRQPTAEVRIAARRNRERVEIDVVDDGPGIPAELRGAVFERFASFDAAGSLASGIGLPLAKELASLAGGELELLDGAPTTFRLSLVAAAGELSESVAPVVAAAPATVSMLSSSARSPTGGRSLLVVEDNAEMATLLARVLGRRYELSLASDVVSACKAFDSKRVDAVLCDVMLPDGDGYDVLEHVQGHTATPFLFLSALGDAEQRARGLTAGADDYLSKPFSSEELHARIDAALRRAAARQHALERQREELLAELHDGVTASLSRAAVLLKAATDPVDGEQVRRAKEAVLEGLAEARSLLQLSTEAVVPWPALLDALRESLSAVQLGFGLETELSVTTDDSVRALSSRAAHTVRRFVREGLTNVIKHAEARSVVLSLSVQDGEIRFVLSDDGRGAASDGPGGMGLAVASRRVRELGGELSVETAPGGGTRLSARFVVAASLPRGPSPDADSRNLAQAS